MPRRLLAAVCLLGVLTSAADARRICPLLCGGNKAAVLWTPVNLGSALVAWWDAQDTAHITFNGSNASAWTDKIGGVVSSQATAAKQPVWSATARNGKPGLSFVSASSQVLSFTPSASFPTGSNAVSVFAAGFSVTGQFFGTIFSYGTALGAQTVRVRTNGSAVADISNSSTDLLGGAWNGTDSALLAQFPAGATPTVSLTQDAGTPVTASFGTMSLTTLGGAIGAIEAGTANFWNGVGQQFLVLNRLLTANETACVFGWESWIDGKAGANLPIGSPYKSAPPTTASNCH